MRLTHIGEAIEAERTKQKLSRERLARVADCTSNTVYSLERDPEYSPSVDLLLRVLDALGLTFSDVEKVA